MYLGGSGSDRGDQKYLRLAKSLARGLVIENNLVRTFYEEWMSSFSCKEYTSQNNSDDNNSRLIVKTRNGSGTLIYAKLCHIDYINLISSSVWVHIMFSLGKPCYIAYICMVSPLYDISNAV